MSKCTGDGDTQSIASVKMEIYQFEECYVKNNLGTSKAEADEDDVHILAPPRAVPCCPAPSDQVNITLAQPFIFSSALIKEENVPLKRTFTEEHFSTITIPSPEPKYSSTKPEETMSLKSGTAGDRLLWRTPNAHLQDSLLEYKSFFSDECDYIVNQLRNKAVEGKSGSKRKLVDMEVSVINEELPPFFCTPDATPNMCSSKRKRIEQLDACSLGKTGEGSKSKLMDIYSAGEDQSKDVSLCRSKRNLNLYFQCPEIFPYGYLSMTNLNKLSVNNTNRGEHNLQSFPNKAAVTCQPLISLKPLNCEGSSRKNCKNFIDPVSSNAKAATKLTPVNEVVGESTATDYWKQHEAHFPPLHILPARSASGPIFKSVPDAKHVAGINLQNTKISTNERKLSNEFLSREKSILIMETNSILDGSLPDLQKINLGSVNSILLENGSTDSRKPISNTEEFQSSFTVVKDNSRTCALSAKVSAFGEGFCGERTLAEEGGIAKERTDASIPAINITWDIASQHCDAAVAGVFPRTNVLLHNLTQDIALYPVKVPAANITQDIVLGMGQTHAANITRDIVSKSDAMHTASVPQDIVLKHGEVAVDLKLLDYKETSNKAMHIASEMASTCPANAKQESTYNIVTAVNATQDIVSEPNSGKVVEKVCHQEQSEVCRKSWEEESTLEEAIFSNGSQSFITSTPVIGNRNCRYITGPVRMPLLPDPSYILGSSQEPPTTKALSKLPIQKRPLGVKLFESNLVRGGTARGSLLPHFVKRCNIPKAVEKESLSEPPTGISSLPCSLPTVASVIQPLKENVLSHNKPQGHFGLDKTFVHSSLAKNDQPRTNNNGPKNAIGTVGMVMHQKTTGNSLAPKSPATKLGQCLSQLSKETVSMPPQLCSRGSGLCIPRGPRNGVSLQRPNHCVVSAVNIEAPAGVSQTGRSRQSLHPPPPLGLQVTCPKKKTLPSGLPKLSRQRR